MSKNSHRRRQSSSILCEVLTERQVYLGCDTGQHTQTVGLQPGQVSQNVYWTQQREILYLRQLQCHWWKGGLKVEVYIK